MTRHDFAALTAPVSVAMPAIDVRGCESGQQELQLGDDWMPVKVWYRAWATGQTAGAEIVAFDVGDDYELRLSANEAALMFGAEQVFAMQDRLSEYEREMEADCR